MKAQDYILAVDDEADARYLVSSILHRAGYIIKTATDGQQALAMLSDYPFTLVISDLLMPDISGLDLLAEVKAQLPTAEVILMTGHGSLESATEALRRGAHDYITKPFTADELIHSVERVLSYRRLKQEKAILLSDLQRRNDELLQLVEASKRLARLSLRQDQGLLEEIAEIAQAHLGLTVAISIFDKLGDPLQSYVPATFNLGWKRALENAVLTAENCRQLMLEANRVSQSYQLVPAQVDRMSSPTIKTAATDDRATRPAGALFATLLATAECPLVGILWVANGDQAVSSEAIQRFEIYANQVVNVLENANMFATQTRQVLTRTALVEAGQRIATVLERQEVIYTVLKAVLKIMPHVELTAVYYKPNNESELDAIGMNREETLFSSNIPVDETWVHQTLHARQAFYQPYWEDESDDIAKSVIIEPLVMGGVSLGALAAVSHRVAAFNDDQQQILTVLANQAAIALQNARLYAEARRADELEALYETGKAINQTLDLQDTLTTTMAISRSLTGASICNVYLYTREGDNYRIDSVVTLDDTLPLTDADRRRAAEIAGDVVSNHSPSLIIEPWTEADPIPPHEPEAEIRTVKTWLAVPLTTNNSPMGVLELGCERPDAFTANDVRLMQIIASQAEAAIENARLYEEVQQRLQQTEALNAISQSISKTLNLHRVLELVVHSAVKTIPVATHSVLYLFDSSHESFVPEAQVITPGKPLPAELATARQSAIQQATQRRQTHRLNWQSKAHGSWSLLVAPLKVIDEVIGAISVESPRLDAFLATDETLLNTFASHASVAIQNANLFRDLSSAYSDLIEKQQELLHSHQTLKAFFEGITDGLYIVDRDLKIIVINQAEAQRLGETPEALFGQACEASLWREAATAVTKIVRDTFETGREGNWESQIDVTRRGPFTDRDVRTYPIFDTAGAVHQVIIFAQDVSEKRRLQASLFRSANMAAVGQLASSIAHQINNPLTVIIANSQIMEMDADPNSPDHPIITYVVEAGMQIRQIVQNLLDFSTQESYDWFETDILETINNALTLIAHSLRKSEIEVVLEIEELPVVIASASHLKLLWMNLLLNARDAISERLTSPPAGIVKLIASQLDSERVKIQIVDNGIGFPHEHRERLFDPFFTTKSAHKNLGLGLHTCRAIVEAHRGHITIDDNPGESGTIVTVILPLEPGVLN